MFHRVREVKWRDFVRAMWVLPAVPFGAIVLLCGIFGLNNSDNKPVKKSRIRFGPGICLPIISGPNSVSLNPVYIHGKLVTS